MQRNDRNSLCAALLAFALAGALPTACNASVSVEECDRLQSFSCGCFPACQNQYVDIVDSQDAAGCKKALSEAFAYWKSCDGTCGLNCAFGWGACAFSSYRAGALAPEHECGPSTGDAGAD